MMNCKHKIKLIPASLIFLLLFMSGCYYDQVYIAPVELPPDPISFATEIQPVFTAKCIACHPPTRGLDLTEGNAYASISNPTYINLGTPEESLIYTKPDPAGSHPGKYSTTEAAIVLKWIQEGANDN